MKPEISLLKVSMLTNLETGQLVKHLLGDIAVINPAIKDEIVIKYVSDLTTGLTNFESALVPIVKHEDSIKLKESDVNRKLALSAMSKCIDQASVSDNEAELAAHTSLSIIFDAHNKKKNINYESETINIDKLLTDLSVPALTDKIKTLGLQRYIDRLRACNEAYKLLAIDRSTTKAQKMLFDSKTLRANMLSVYDDLNHYVLAMVKAHNTTEFVTLLSTINATRKQYADTLAKHLGRNKAAAANAISKPVAPVDNTTPGSVTSK